MKAEPIAVKVTRHVCPFCRRGWSKKAPAATHVAACWRNPANRTCKTCAFLKVVPNDPHGCERFGPSCSCAEGSITCTADVDLKDGDPEAFPRVACPLWEVIM